jgi:uncharacterized protein
MPIVTQHTPGSPCWFELATSDQDSAKQFYSELFGWSSFDLPIGPAGFYSMFQLDGKDVAAGYTLMPEQTQQGVPPHWMVYFHTPDVDASTKKAEETGAVVMAPPMDVFDSVRVAMLQDPTGAHFALCQPKAHTGAGVINEINTIGWSELITPDPPRALAFYQNLLGWETKPSANAPVEYTEFLCGGEARGGVMKLTAEFGEMPPCWSVYMVVADCAATAQKAASLGGRACHGPFEAPGVGHIAVMNDPQGAMFNIIQLSRPMH